MGTITGNNNQVTINISDAIPPENMATIDQGTLVGNTKSKVQLDEWQDGIEEQLSQISTSAVKGEATTTSSPTPYTPVTYPKGLYEKWEIKTAGTYTNFKDASDQPIVVTTADLDKKFVYINVTNGVSKLDITSVPGVNVAGKFDPLDDVNAQGGKQINTWLIGSSDTASTSLKTFEGTLMPSYPTGYFDASGALVSDSTRRITGSISLPENINTIDFKNWNAAYRGVFHNDANVVLGVFLTNNNTPISVPNGAKKINIGIKSTSVEVDLNSIQIVFNILVKGEKKKIISPEELEARIDLRTTGEIINHGFSQYSNFDSFTSGYVDANGLIQPDATNVRKLSPQIDVSLYSKFTSHMSIVGAYYSITDAAGIVVKTGVLGSNISIPSGSKNLIFTIKGSSSQSNLATDYIVFTKGIDIDYILKKSDISSFNSQLDQYLQISRTTGIGSLNIDQWENFSDGSASVSLAEGGIKLLDNITTVNNQAKIRTLKFELANKFSVFMKVKFLQLNNSYNMDILDGNINGYGETNNTDDDNINKSGFSFAVIHPTLSVRPIFSIVKAIDYDTSGNLEIWRITKPANFVAGFERIWTGKDIPMNAFFDMQIDFLFNTATNTNYYISITVNGRRLVNQSLMGMNSNYAGNSSLLFQCKGTATEPAEYIVKDVKVLQQNPDKANMMSYLLANI